MWWLLNYSEIMLEFLPCAATLMLAGWSCVPMVPHPNEVLRTGSTRQTLGEALPGGSKGTNEGQSQMLERFGWAFAQIIP